MKPHQTAKTAVATMPVMAIEISSEIAASLIQSVKARNFQSAQLQRFSCVASFRVMLGRFPRHAIAFFHRCGIVERPAVRCD
jgi:hypothetical protein